MKKSSLLFLGILLFLGVLVRLYNFNNPVADWHSWRQADTAAVTWNLVRIKFDVLHPRYFDISNVQSGLDNPHGYRYVEFPLYNIVSAWVYWVSHGLTLEGSGRVVTIFSSIAGSLFLFLLVKRRFSSMAAWFALLFSLFLPFNIYYGRTILPDTSMVATLLGGIFFLDKWLDAFRKKSTKPQIVFILLATLFIASSLLLKPYVLFYGIAIFALIFSVLGWKLLRRWELWGFFLLSLAPLVWWRLYMISYPEGIPANSWLFNENHIRFRPAFFRWIFYERLTKLIAGYVGDIFMITGIIGIIKNKNERIFFSGLILSALVYICTLATGNVQHDYYQIVAMPVVAIVMGIGASWLVVFLKRFVPGKIAYFLVGIIIVSGFWVSWLQVRDFFNIDNIAIVDAGRAIRKITPQNAKLLAPYGGDTTLLYYTKRQGWPSFEHNLSMLIVMGADYLVLVNPNPDDYNIGKHYKIVSSSKDYLLFDLHKTL